MVAKILDCRMDDNKSVKQRLPLSDNDPRRISTTIAMVTLAHLHQSGTGSCLSLSFDGEGAS